MSMIYTYDGTNASTNLNPNNGGEVMWYLKQTLVQAGWTVIGSGDGTAGATAGTNYSKTGDIFTTLSSVKSGSGGLLNNGAWFLLRQPASVRNSQRQLLFKNGYTGAYTTYMWPIKYSYGGLYTTASVNAGSVLPTASDETVINLGYAQFPTTFVGSNSNTYRLNVSADNSAPYGFWAGWFPYGTTGTTCSGMMVFDPLLDGTYDSNDADPYIFYFPNAQASTPPTASGNGSNVVGSISYESPGGVLSLYKDKTAALTVAIVNTPGLILVSGGTPSLTVPASLSANPFSGKDEVVPILYARRSALSSPGFKGMGTLMKWTGTQRNTGDTLSIASSGAKDRIVMGQVSFPWNGTSVLV
jgi:hypothetical protein